VAPAAARVSTATGKLAGEGFDHPALDTLVLALPVSWRGTLQQYAGRLQRADASRTDLQIIGTLLECGDCPAAPLVGDNPPDAKPARFEPIKRREK